METMSIDTVSNPMWDNFRKLLKMLQEQDINFKQYRITYGEGRMEVLILSIIPKWFTVDDYGIYIDSENVL